MPKKKYMSRKLKYTANPSEPLYPGHPDRVDPPPFVRGIETNTERRVYSFVPDRKGKFQIVIEFPIKDHYDLKIQVAGESINPDELVSAMKFVQQNEAQFAEAFDRSVEYKPTQLTDENFLEIPE